MGTPLLENEGLLRLLGLSGLSDAPCEARRAEHEPPMIVIHQVAGAEVLAAWRRLRALLPRTGRYPVVVPAEAEGLGLDDTRERALRIAPLLDLDQDERLRDDEATQAQARLRAELSSITRHAEPPCAAMHWTLPEPGQRYAIAMPPAASMWEAALHLPWRGAESRPDLLAALLRHWERRFGAELVFALPGSLNFTVRRPPATLVDAVALAARQRAVARIDCGLQAHARALLGAERWSLAAPL